MTESEPRVPSDSLPDRGSVSGNLTDAVPGQVRPVVSAGVAQELKWSAEDAARYIPADAKPDATTNRFGVIHEVQPPRRPEAHTQPEAPKIDHAAEAARAQKAADQKAAQAKEKAAAVTSARQKLADALDEGTLRDQAAKLKNPADIRKFASQHVPGFDAAVKSASAELSQLLRDQRTQKPALVENFQKQYGLSAEQAEDAAERHQKSERDAQVNKSHQQQLGILDQAAPRWARSSDKPIEAEIVSETKSESGPVTLDVQDVEAKVIPDTGGYEKRRSKPEARAHGPAAGRRTGESSSADDLLFEVASEIFGRAAGGRRRQRPSASTDWPRPEPAVETPAATPTPEASPAAEPAPTPEPEPTPTESTAAPEPEATPAPAEDPAAAYEARINRETHNVAHMSPAELMSLTVESPIVQGLTPEAREIFFQRREHVMNSDPIARLKDVMDDLSRGKRLRYGDEDVIKYISLAADARDSRGRPVLSDWQMEPLNTIYVQAMNRLEHARAAARGETIPDRRGQPPVGRPVAGDPRPKRHEQLLAEQDNMMGHEVIASVLDRFAEGGYDLRYLNVDRLAHVSLSGMTREQVLEARETLEKILRQPSVQKDTRTLQSLGWLRGKFVTELNKLTPKERPQEPLALSPQHKAAVDYERGRGAVETKTGEKFMRGIERLLRMDTREFKQDMAALDKVGDDIEGLSVFAYSKNTAIDPRVKQIAMERYDRAQRMLQPERDRRAAQNAEARQDHIRHETGAEPPRNVRDEIDALIRERNASIAAGNFSPHQSFDQDVREILAEAGRQGAATYDAALAQLDDNYDAVKATQKRRIFTTQRPRFYGKDLHKYILNERISRNYRKNAA